MRTNDFPSCRIVKNYIAVRDDSYNNGMLLYAWQTKINNRQDSAFDFFFEFIESEIVFSCASKAQLSCRFYQI